MREHDETEDLRELGAASDLTKGDYCPGCIEAFVILDYYDMP